jgi:hypothetical protein
VNFECEVCWREIIKKGHQHRVYLIKYKNGDLLADSQCSVDRWKNYFSKPADEFREPEIHIPELLVPEPSLMKLVLSLRN